MLFLARINFKEEREKKAGNNFVRKHEGNLEN